MDDIRASELREKHERYARDLGRIEDIKERSDSIVAAFPHNPIVWLVAWLVNLSHKRLAEDERKAREAARRTYDR